MGRGKETRGAKIPCRDTPYDVWCVEVRWSNSSSLFVLTGYW